MQNIINNESPETSLNQYKNTRKEITESMTQHPCKTQRVGTTIK